jgi:hypothetical protein
MAKIKSRERKTLDLPFKLTKIERDMTKKAIAFFLN